MQPVRNNMYHQNLRHADPRRSRDQGTTCERARRTTRHVVRWELYGNASHNRLLVLPGVLVLESY